MLNVNRNASIGGFRITDSQTRAVQEKKIDIPVVDNTESRKQLIARIEDLTATTIQQICSGRLPQIFCTLPRNCASLDTQTSDDTDFESQFHEESGRDSDETERYGTRPLADFASKRGKDKFALIMIVMATAHRLLITNCTVTRRSLYYDLKNENTWHLVPEQRYLDQAVNHVANLLNCPPWELNLLPTSKGLAAGELTLTLSDNRIIDCRVPGGALIPHILSNVISVRAKAKMVLIVEKDAVFQKLLEDNCTSSLECILITGKGYPDVATRMLVKLLSEKLQLPVYIVVDADPFGVDIMCIYRFGSITLSRQRESLACSNVRWLGVHPSELQALAVNRVPLTEFDFSKLTALQARPYMTPELLRELEIMRSGKAEIENVCSTSRKFLVAAYLPCKIKGDDYI
ncbi:PREDICTED: meiotic recombination protein W68 [Eufriesea mexicana]|nr:PREDICTED: meiotic recombination protein W68 [Eufriesea mexicana]